MKTSEDLGGLFGLTLFVAVILLIGTSPRQIVSGVFSREPRSQGARYPRGTGDWLVVPGKRAGDVAIGDAVEKVLGLFPKASVGSAAEPRLPDSTCGTEYTIGLLQDAKFPGFLKVFAKRGRIIEIEAGGAHYHTARGIASNSSPGDVEAHYKDMKSYLFLHCCDESLNGGPLIVWTDTKGGMGFSFAFPDLRHRRLLVSTMIVFAPASRFCEQNFPVGDPSWWRELRPYGLGSFGPRT